MKNKIKCLIKSILLVLISITVFGTSISEVNAVAQTITLGAAEDIPGYVAGTYFTTKRSSSGDYLYCLDLHKDTAQNTTATLVGEKDAGLAYILENGYPNKSFTGERLKDYYITQTAVWWYLDLTTNSSNLGSSFKETGSDPYNLRPTIKSLVTKAQAKKKEGYATTKLTISAKNTEMTLKDGYYISDAIQATTHSNISKYTVTLTNAPEGSKIIDASGNEKNTFNVSESFKIKVPASKVSGTSLKIKATAKATGTVNKAYEYKPKYSNMQSVTSSVLVPEKTDVSSSVDLQISTSKVTILKIDKATGKALAGAKLVVKDSSGKEVTNPWISTTNAHVIGNLKNGTYTVEELEAPKGYKLNKQAMKFTISDTSRDIQVKFYNEAKSSVVNIVKIDASTGNPLAGAVLVVKDSNGKEYKFTTTTDPYVLTDLEDGTYTVEELEAPDGYMLSSEKITFTIDDDHLSHQITFENHPEVVVPNTSSASSIIFTILGIAIIGIGIGFIYKNGKKAK